MKAAVDTWRRNMAIRQYKHLTLCTTPADFILLRMRNDAADSIICEQKKLDTANRASFTLPLPICADLNSELFAAEKRAGKKQTTRLRF